MVGQAYKGGPDEGLFLQLSAKEMMDLPLPGQPYGFATLFRSQQLGDFLAMAQLGRPVGEIRFANRTEAERFLDLSLKQG
jgi:transaldolase/glucose-6-phosphate isomerase